MSKVQGKRPVRRAEYWAILGSLAFVAVCFYGIRAAAVIGLAGVTAMLTDLICLFLHSRPYKLVDLANIGNAVVLALLFPATVPYSIVILSTVFAVAVGTHVFGSRKDLLFPPAAVGYLFALINWKDEILQFPQVGKHLALFHNDVTLSPSLSSLFNEKGSFTALHTEPLDLVIGAVSSPMGTSCLLMLILGAVILLLRRQLNLWAVIGFLYCGVIPALLLHTSIGIYATNMLLFSLIYFVADPSVMPCRGAAALLAGLFTAALTGLLIALFRIEYAPVVAVILSCPFWRFLSTFGPRSRNTAVSAEEGQSNG